MIPEKTQARPLGEEYTYISIEKLKVSPFQTRQHISSPELEELKNSIKERGVIQPLIVRKKGDYYEIVAGSRRYYASKSLGHKELPVIIKNIDDKESLIISILENLQRQNLNPIEEARSFKRLSEEFNLTHAEIANSLGKERATISNAIRLLKLPEVIQRALREGKINMSAARTLLSLDSEAAQIKMFEKILRERLPVRNLETKVRKRRSGKDLYVSEAENKLQRSWGRKVEITLTQKGQGKVAFSFYSLQDLERLIEKLNKLKDN